MGQNVGRRSTTARSTTASSCCEQRRGRASPQLPPNRCPRPYSGPLLPTPPAGRIEADDTCRSHCRHPSRCSRRGRHAFQSAGRAVHDVDGRMLVPRSWCASPASRRNGSHAQRARESGLCPSASVPLKKQAIREKGAVRPQHFFITSPADFEILVRRTYLPARQRISSRIFIQSANPVPLNSVLINHQTLALQSTEYSYCHSAPYKVSL